MRPGREIRFDKDYLDCIPLQPVTKTMRDANDTHDANDALDDDDDGRPCSLAEYVYSQRAQREALEARERFEALRERLQEPIKARELDDGRVYFQFRGSK